MFFTLLACIYISVVCWAWGRIFFRFLYKITRLKTEYHFSITCIAGLSLIMIVSGILSLFIPLGWWMIQLIFLLPAFFILFAEYKSNFKSVLKNTFSLLPASLFLLLLSAAVILIMSSWKIIHPDTLGYHAQLIQWIEKYRAIPGLVNLNARYGLQSNWFLAGALFSFKFTGSQALLYLNSAVLLWFIIFIVNKINQWLAGSENPVTGFLWIILFGFSFWSYTQVRLMATSASPDFFTVILIWTCLFLFCARRNQTKDPYYPDYFLMALLCCAAITVKLFALPVIILFAALIYFLLRQKKFKYTLLVLGIAIITLVPYLARNVITSGYPLFPSVYGNFPVDWKLDETVTRQIASYVTVYSRTAISYSNPAVQNVLQMKWTEWLPIWWKVLSTADKTMMCLLLLSVVSSFLFIRKLLRSDSKSKIAILVCSIGLVFWFIMAPDPRFGFGFIFGFAGITGSIIFSAQNHVLASSIKKVAIASVLLIGLLLTVYVFYRFKKFYAQGQWLSPIGTEKVKYKTVTCNDIKLNIQMSTLGCGDAEVPCSYDSCGLFSARGTKISDGFAPK